MEWMEFSSSNGLGTIKYTKDMDWERGFILAYGRQKEK